MSTRWYVKRMFGLDTGLSYLCQFCYLNSAQCMNPVVYIYDITSICLRYPIYQRGNPQLRVFLPNFWMKLVRHTPKQLPNIVHFQCSMEMTKFDIKNYLEKIYNVPVVQVRTNISLGRFRRDIGKGYVVKDDDIKYAFVTLVSFL